MMAGDMTFTSWGFWAAFAAVFLVVSGWRAWLPTAWHRPWVRQAMLLTFSLGFYTLVGGKLVAVLLLSISLNHLLAQAIHASSGSSRTGITTVAVAFNLGLLGVFKYAYFVADWWPGQALPTLLNTWRLDQWMLPIGISFYTFQAISYVVDVHRGTLAKPASLLSFATYITFFPQLVAGPIVRAKEFLPQLTSATWVCTPPQQSIHVQLILAGFLKKLVLGDLVGAWLVDPVFERPGDWVSWEVLLALYGYSLQVYADFSGYTDMAKGMAGLLGIALPDNFRFPYRATSPSDFWRRWHITLSQWWKDYLYIPLGGNRSLSPFSLVVALCALAGGVLWWGELGGALVLVGGALLTAAAMLMLPTFQRKVTTSINVLIVMVVGGLWHGAHLNFLTWGLLNGLILVAWVLMPKGPSSRVRQVLGWMLTFHTVVLARIWFRAGSLISWNESTAAPHPEDAWGTAMVLWRQLQAPPLAWSDLVWSPTYAAGLALMAFGYALHFMPQGVRDAWKQQTTSLPLWLTWLLWCIATMLALWCSVSYPKPFIYWQF